MPSSIILKVAPHWLRRTRGSLPRPLIRRKERASSLVMTVLFFRALSRMDTCMDRARRQMIREISTRAIL